MAASIAISNLVNNVSVSWLGGGSLSASGGTLTFANALIRSSNTTDAADVSGASGSFGTLGGISIAKSGWFGSTINGNQTATVASLENKKALSLTPAYTATADSANCSMFNLVGTYNGSTFNTNDVRAVFGQVTFTGSGTATITGLNFTSIYGGSGGATSLVGLTATASVLDTSSGTLTTVYGGKFTINKGGLGTGPTMTDAIGVYINNASGVRTNAYGLYIENAVGGTLSYAIYTNSGVVRVGDSTEATTGGAGALVSVGGIYAAKKIITASTLTTASGVTIDIGAKTAGVVALDAANYVAAIIGGTSVKLLIAS